jgi:hypothetical protein
MKELTDLEKEYILCAAIWFDYDLDNVYPHQPKNIEKGYVICGRRHHNVFAIHTLIGKPRNHIQGFVTNKDRFVGRKEAYDIAIKAMQISSRTENKGLDQYFKTEPEDSQILISEDLYSEDLY